MFCLPSPYVRLEQLNDSAGNLFERTRLEGAAHSSVAAQKVGDDRQRASLDDFEEESRATVG